MTEYVQVAKGIQYDGTNGAAVVAAFAADIDDIVFVSDNGTTVTWTHGGSTMYMDVGEWKLWDVFGGFAGAEVAAAFAARRRAFPKLVERVGTATVPGQSLGGTHNVDVTISPAMSSTAFEPDISLRGNAAVVGGHSVLSHTVLDEETVRVQFNSTALSQNITVRVVARELV